MDHQLLQDLRNVNATRQIVNKAITKRKSENYNKCTKLFTFFWFTRKYHYDLSWLCTEIIPQCGQLLFSMYLKGQCHEIIFTQRFSSTISFWSYKRYSIRILNFTEFSRCYSTIKEPRRCRLHRWVWTPLCSIRRGVWTHRCRLHRQVWTPRCSLHRWARSPVRPTQRSSQKFSVLTETRRCRLHREVWALWCRLH